MSVAAPTIAALGPVQGRHSPPIARQRDARRPSRPHSGPLRAFQTHGDYPRVPPGIPLRARQSRFPAPLTPRGPPPRLPPGPAIDGPPSCGRRGAVPSPLPLPAARLPVKFADRRGSMSVAAPTISALGPVQGRHSPPGRGRGGCPDTTSPLNGPRRPSLVRVSPCAGPLGCPAPAESPKIVGLTLDPACGSLRSRHLRHRRRLHPCRARSGCAHLHCRALPSRRRGCLRPARGFSDACTACHCRPPGHGPIRRTPIKSR